MDFEQEFHVRVKDFSNKLADELIEEVHAEPLEDSTTWSERIEDAFIQFYKEMEKLKNAKRIKVNT
jgi:hypothetical protein